MNSYLIALMKQGFVISTFTPADGFFQIRAAMPEYNSYKEFKAVYDFREQIFFRSLIL